MDPRKKSYSREEKEKLIWKNKHSDFKSEPGAEPTVMVPASMIREYGSLVQLSSMDDQGINKLFEDALAVEVSNVKKNIFASVFDGKYKHLNQAAINQWSDSFDDMRNFADGVRDAMDVETHNKVLDEIDKFEHKFNAEPSVQAEIDVGFSR